MIYLVSKQIGRIKDPLTGWTISVAKAVRRGTRGKYLHPYAKSSMKPFQSKRNITGAYRTKSKIGSVKDTDTGKKYDVYRMVNRAFAGKTKTGEIKRGRKFYVYYTKRKG